METLTDAPFSLDAEALISRARVRPGSEDAREIKGLVQLAIEIGRPKAAYAVAFVEARDGDAVRIGGESFTSRMLARNLETVERVFPFVATCGHEMDQAPPARGSMLAQFHWDTIKAALLSAARKHLGDHLSRKFRLGKTSSMMPGSGDATVWPIEQQRDLFALLGDVKAEIGVTLTDSCLMVPNKSISGIVFPTERDFRACQVCHREGCPSRSAAFDPALWQALEHE